MCWCTRVGGPAARGQPQCGLPASWASLLRTLIARFGRERTAACPGAAIVWNIPNICSVIIIILSFKTDLNCERREGRHCAIDDGAPGLQSKKALDGRRRSAASGRPGDDVTPQIEPQGRHPTAPERALRILPSSFASLLAPRRELRCSAAALQCGCGCGSSNRPASNRGEQCNSPWPPDYGGGGTLATTPSDLRRCTARNQLSVTVGQPRHGGISRPLLSFE